MKTIISTLILSLFTTITFSQKVSPMIGSVSLTQPTCNGYSNGEISIIPSGGLAPYTYLWSNGDTTQTISNINAGNYTVIVNDSYGQTMAGMFTLIEPSPILVEGVISNTAMNTSNGVIDITNVNGVVGPYTWTWASNNNQVMDQTSLDQSNLKSGYYKIVILDGNGCEGVGYFEVKSFVKPLSKPGLITNGISNTSSAIQTNNNTTRSNRDDVKITLYPNPSNGDVQIDSDCELKQIVVVNANTGEEVYKTNNKTTELKLTNLNSGNYIFNMITEDEVVSKTVTVF